VSRHVALVYDRLSQNTEGDDVESSRRRVEICVRHCEQQGWTPEVYRDIDGHRSGLTEENRDDWLRLKQQFARPEVVAVVAHSLDRISRSVLHVLQLIQELGQHGIQLVSATEPVDVMSAYGRGIVTMRSAFAELEARRTGERVQAMIEWRKSHGIHWGRTPYGYDREEDGLLVPNAEADSVRECFELFMSRSYAKTADELNARGRQWRDRQGNPAPWTRDSVRSVISNWAIYRGYVPAGRGKDHPAVRDAPDLLPGAHQPLITHELAEAAQEKRRVSTRFAGQRISRVYPLSGVLHCANCGSPMRGQALRGEARYVHSRRTCANGLGWVGAEEIEAEALELLRFTPPPWLVAAVRESMRAQSAEGDGAEALRQKAQHLEGKQSRLRLMFSEGFMAADEFRRQYGAVQRELDGVQSQLAALGYDVDQALDGLADIHTVLEHGAPEDQREALQALVDRIDVGLDGHLSAVQPCKWIYPLYLEMARVALCRNMPPRDLELGLRHSLAMFASMPCR